MGLMIFDIGKDFIILWIFLNANVAFVFVLDSSGIRIHYTEHKRRYELGNVQIGQNDIEIAPNSLRIEHAGSCSSYCTSELMASPFYLTRTFIHMHSLGTYLKTCLWLFYLCRIYVKLWNGIPVNRVLHFEFLNTNFTTHWN